MHAVVDTYRARELLWNLTLRELRTKYRRSFLGWAWSMLNPLATVAIYGFVFGTLFAATAPVGVPSGLDGFAYYLLCGLLPWNFFALVNNLGLGAIWSNAGLVRRVAFPREVLVFANVLHSCVQFAIEMTLLCVVLLIAGSPILPWLPLVLLTSVLLAVFGAGFALALSVLSVYFRDMNYLWAIVLQVWFFATPIVYPPSLLEDRAPEWIQTILAFNPINGFVEVYRRLLYDAAAPGLTTMLAVTVVSFASLALGWLVFRRFVRRLPEEV
ncbi:MAG: ABC transporter permease [Ilumatobacteraceae bacterium]